ncbi:uncharacterized protein LOC123532953 [Mercenaria mercenaria]|uniref:uncharacterized protein LOC123532953 n=1 Tax=Mercenaria mercenaria TaxID=6596 RepID=UPI00234E7719|nr:uncharacterized protein LOC123532953 [Mercenaria mercenaria]
MHDYVIADTPEPCATHYNWYMIGALPQTPNVETEVVVCKNTPKNNCSVTNVISTILCQNGNYVFYLKGTYGCSEAYCIKSLTGDEGASAPDISVMAKPVVTVDITNDHEFVFYCVFDAPSVTYLYDIDWSLSTGISLTKRIKTFKDIKYEGPAAFQSTTQLKENDLRQNGIRTLGFSLVCSVKAKADIAGKYSESRVSDRKFCGVEVSNNGWISVKHNTSGSVHLRLTVPFALQFPDQLIHFMIYIPTLESDEKCQLSQAALIDSKYEKNNCMVTFSGNDVKNEKWKELKLAALIGQKTMSFDRVFTVQLISLRHHPQPIFSNYSIDPLHVQILSDTRSVDGKKCYAHSDPHMFSFDERQYENQNQGTFILYRNALYNVEVQIKTDRCPNHFNHQIRPWCTCAVAVRAGRDIFKIDNCGTGGIVEPRFERCDDRVLQRKVKRKEGGREFRIYLPSGTEIRLQMNWETFIEVDIFPSILDKGNTDGLCGDFDDNELNDPDVDTALGWRVGETNDLFNLDKLQAIKPWVLEKYLCTCDAEKNDDFIFTSIATCDTSMAQKCVHDNLVDVEHSMCSLVRRKRSMDQLFYSIDRHSSIETNFSSSSKRSIIKHSVLKRSIYTTETAREDCMNTLNNTLFQMCSHLPTLDMEPFIDNCIADALVTNSMDWTNIHLEGIKKQCIYNMEVNQPLSDSVLSELNRLTEDPNDFKKNDSEYNSSFSTTETPTTIVSAKTPVTEPSFTFTPEMLEHIKSVSCLNDCSGHGKCSEGNCICDSGYMDIDCSISENDAPQMLGIPDRGICDLRQRKCQKTSVFGKNIVESPNLLCKLQPFQIERNGQAKEQTTMTNQALLESFTQATCDLPSIRNKRSGEYLNDDFVARGYRISLSNNGKIYSEEDIIIIFDSECVNCSKSHGEIVCSAKPGYCINNGNCYKSGESFGCYTCTGDQLDKVAWTSGPGTYFIQTTYNCF